jgi:acetolactate synthase I/II/III large subunit
LTAPTPCACEQLFYDDLHSYKRFGRIRLAAGMASMFPGLTFLDVTDVDGFSAPLRTALDVDGPLVVGVECSPDESPPLAPFLAAPSAEPIAIQQIPIRKENRTDVATRA